LFSTLEIREGGFLAMSIKGGLFLYERGFNRAINKGLFLAVIRAINKGDIRRYKKAISCDYLGRLIRATIKGFSKRFSLAIKGVSHYLIF
jgi:hypothetical protein